MMGFKIKDYNSADTIAAIATFPSKSALGVIKISGKKSLSIVSRVFAPRRKKNIKKAANYTLHYGWIVEKTEDRGQKTEGRGQKYVGTGLGSVRGKHDVVDEVLVSVMRGPSSYTKEDVVEISSHGGAVVLNKILEIILKKGARLALPGEFTYRALIAGRIDLLQAESISGIVEAKTEKSLNLASSQLRGEASDKIRKLQEEVKEIFVHTESAVNFPEENLGISFSDLKGKIERLEKKINNILEGSNEAKIIREGAKCVICGRANVGKSTLFNRLLREERVIVSKFAGTTRDVIEETINVKGVPLRIYDTAGILEPGDLITKKALEKTSHAFRQADLVILILDGSRKLNKDDFFLLDKVKDQFSAREGKSVILVINKIDLPQRIDLKYISPIKGAKVKMSALKGKDLGKLEKAVCDNVYKSKADREDIIFLNQYQRQVLERAKDDIGEVRKFIKAGHTIDFVNLSLKNCLENLGKISGEVFSEEILESIFSKFCIGK